MFIKSLIWQDLLDLTYGIILWGSLHHLPLLSTVSRLLYHEQLSLVLVTGVWGVLEIDHSIVFSDDQEDAFSWSLLGKPCWRDLLGVAWQHVQTTIWLFLKFYFRRENYKKFQNIFYPVILIILFFWRKQNLKDHLLYGVYVFRAPILCFQNSLVMKSSYRFNYWAN